MLSISFGPSLHQQRQPYIYEHSESEILTGQNLQGLLQRNNLFLTHLHAIFIAEFCVDALCFELVVVIQGLVKLSLCKLQVLVQLSHCLGAGVLLVGLVLNFGALNSNILVGLIHEFLVSACRRVLRTLCLCLQTSEIRKDDFEHAHDASVAGLLTLVWVQRSCLVHVILQASGVLNECRGGVGRVELLEHGRRLFHSSLCHLGIGNGCRICLLLVRADASGRVLLPLDLGNLVAECCNLGGELLVEGSLRLELSGQLVNLRGLDFACLLVSSHFSRAVCVLVGLCVGFLHQLHDQILDHFFDLAKWVCCSMSGNQGQILAAKLLCAALQELDNTLPDIIVFGCAAQVCQGRCLCLEERRWQMLVTHARHISAQHDFDRLVEGRDLAMANNLVLLILVRGLQALGVSVAEHTLVLQLGGLCNLFVTLRSGCISQALRLMGSFLFDLGIVFFDVISELLVKHLIVCFRGHLLFLKSKPLVLELQPKLFEEGDNTP